MKTMKVDFEVLELDQMGNEGVEIQKALLDMTNQNSVPNVFVGGKHLGGNNDTQAAARNGTLQEMLK
jgi:glutaredoxin 3